MMRILNRLGLIAVVVGTVGVAAAQTYGNTTPFETYASHSPNFVLGVRVTIPQTITLQSFGMIYGLPTLNQPAISNAIFGLYSSSVGNGLPSSLVAVTNPINLNADQTYDHIAFTSTPTIGAGTYWMMALYQSQANPRLSLLDSTSLVAYWANPYASGMPANAPAITTYSGQNFNYWVNGGAVPEPASLAVLGIGALAMIRRRRDARK